jgi:hypothetical protein
MFTVGIKLGLLGCTGKDRAIESHKMSQFEYPDRQFQKISGIYIERGRTR